MRKYHGSALRKVHVYTKCWKFTSRRTRTIWKHRLCVLRKPNVNIKLTADFATVYWCLRRCVNVLFRAVTKAKAVRHISLNPQNATRTLFPVFPKFPINPVKFTVSGYEFSVESESESEKSFWKVLSPKTKVDRL